MASLVLVKKDGRTTTHLSTSQCVAGGVEIMSGELLSWRDSIYFDFWPENFPESSEIKMGKAVAFIKRGRNSEIPNYVINVEGSVPEDLFDLVSVCLKKLGGEVIAIDPRPREHSLYMGIRDDSRRLKSFIVRNATKVLQKLKFKLPG